MIDVQQKQEPVKCGDTSAKKLKLQANIFPVVILWGR